MDNKIIIEELKKNLGLNWNKIIALYQVGLTDGSVLSDIDLVVVINEVRYKKRIVEAITSLKSNIKIDLRKIVTEKEFIKGFQYEPYARLELVAGQELTSEMRFLSPEDEGLIKLSAMFFTSFLRNFYWLKEKKASTKEILINLNDFAYVPLWLSDAPLEIIEFNQLIHKLRQRYPEVSEEECKYVLDGGIDFAWKMVGILNEKLLKNLNLKKETSLFLGREPTICISYSTNECRKLTENNLHSKHRLKIIYLPQAFELFFVNNICFDDNLSRYVSKYRHYNLSLAQKSIGGISKNTIKKIFTIFLYFKHIFKK
jgi:hypothetical protein